MSIGLHPFLWRFVRFSLALLSAYAVLCLILYFSQERLLFHPTAIPRTYTFAFTHPFSEVFIPVDGATLAAIHFSVPNSKGLVLYLHGNGDSALDAEALAQPILQRGYDIFFVDYRGYGKSTGSIDNEEQLHHDVQVIYNYLHQTYPDDQLILYGRSVGTGLAVALAANIKPRLLILEAPYVSMQDIVSQNVPFVPSGLLKYPLHSDQWIGQVACPIVLIHGTNDPLIPYSSSERLQRLIVGPSELIPIPGAGHGNVLGFAVYQQLFTHLLP